jgi:hypothetical protein
MKESTVTEVRDNQDPSGGTASARYRTPSKRWYYDVAIGSRKELST